MNISTRVGVLVIDAEPVARFGLRSLLAAHDVLKVVGEAETVRLGRQLCSTAKPDVVVIDPGMEGGEGFAFLQDARRWEKEVRTVAFSACESAVSVQRAFSLGAYGYITRRDPVASLIGAILGAVTGERHVGPGIERVLLHQLATGTMSICDDAGLVLSSREQQVFRLMGEGATAQKMAALLGLSVKTVESHQQRIKKKLRLSSGVELRQCALTARNGEIPPDVEHAPMMACVTSR